MKEVQDDGFPFHAISSIEVKSTPNVKFDLADRMFNHIKQKNKRGFLTIPNLWIGFDGVLTCAKDAPPYKVRISDFNADP